MPEKIPQVYIQESKNSCHGFLLSPKMANAKDWILTALTSVITLLCNLRHILNKKIMWLLLKLWFPKKTKIFIYIFFLQKIETWSNYCGFFSKIIEESLFFVAQNLRILDIYKYNTTLNAPIRNIYFYWFLCSYIQQKKIAI